ncbi:MAG: sulfotransferase [Balneolaceae bacterium]
MNQIHIVGVSPRSGTTLLAVTMKTCFAIDYCTPHEERLFTRPAYKTNTFITKRPADIMIAGPSLKVDPNLYVICMIRDPRDIICSIHQKNPNQYWAGLKFWNVYSKKVRKLESHDRFIAIRYEQLVSNPDHVQDVLTRKIPFLKKIVPFSKYHIAAEVSDSAKQALKSLRPIKPTSVEKWKKHKERIAGQIKKHGSISEDLITFGYEDDDQWINELEGIEPDLSESHHKEYMTVKKRLGLSLGKYVEAARRIIEQIVGFRIRITHPQKWV